MRTVFVALLGISLVAAFAPTASAASGTMIVPLLECEDITVTAGATFLLAGTNALGMEADFDIYFSSGEAHENYGNEAGTVPAGATSAEVCLYSASKDVDLVPGPADWTYTES